MRSAGQSRRISWEFEIWLARTTTSGQLANPGSCLPSPFAVVKREAISLRCAKKDSSAAARTIIPYYWVMSLHSILNFTLGIFSSLKSQPHLPFFVCECCTCPGQDGFPNVTSKDAFVHIIYIIGSVAGGLASSLPLPVDGPCSLWPRRTKDDLARYSPRIQLELWPGRLLCSTLCELMVNTAATPAAAASSTAAATTLLQTI